MEKNLHIVVKMNILPGKLNELKKMIPDLNAHVKAGEPETTLYKWYIDESNQRCYLVETMVSGESMLQHLQNIGSVLPALLSIAPITEWEIYGDLSNQVSETVKSIAKDNNVTLINVGYISGFERMPDQVMA
jgi:quinol monooxygenase YgiN